MLLFSQETFNFLSNFIYGNEFDGPIRNGLRYNQKIDDVLKHQDLEHHWKKIVSGSDCKDKSADQVVTMDDDLESSPSTENS